MIDNFGEFGVVAAISIVVIFILFMNVAAGYCLCCHPDREDSENKFAIPVYDTGNYHRV